LVVSQVGIYTGRILKEEACRLAGPAGHKVVLTINKSPGRMDFFRLLAAPFPMQPTRRNQNRASGALTRVDS
jgi:hypothetical protein